MHLAKPIHRLLSLLSLSIAVSLVLALSTQAKKEDSKEVPPEYAELNAIVEAEKTLMKRMESDVAKEKLDKEIGLRINEIIESYKAYIDRYPQSVFGQILYGKFLRKADRAEDAYSIFLDIHQDNPDIAVVNQHLALFASEIGDYKDAYKYFQKAITLDPDQALYHYQYGEFIYTFRFQFMRDHLMTISEIEETMVASFQKAHELAPENRDFHARWAESYFDKYNPDWDAVLQIWDDLLATSSNLFERDVFRLQKARVLIEQKKFYDAGELLKSVSDPTLIEAKAKLMQALP